MSSGCPPEPELDRALASGIEPALRAHLETCASCSALVEATDFMLELARELPAPLPPRHLVEQQRTAILAGAPVLAMPSMQAPPPMARAWTRDWRAGGVALATIAAVVAIVVGVTAQRPGAPSVVQAAHPHRGTVHPHEGAIYSLAAQPPDEIVRLRAGTIDIDVDPLQAGERFRVIVGTDTVEVRGTSFEVAAAADQLIAVHVVHGHVEVTHGTNPTVVLGNGDRWTPPPPSPSPSPPLPPPPLPRSTSSTHPSLAPKRPTLATTPAPAVVTSTPQEVAFDDGWAAMREKDYGRGAAAFARAVALAPDGALAEDAAFWHAAALGRLQRTSEAITALRSFLDAYPTSARAGNAVVMLGWLLVASKEVGEARTLFERAADDPNAEVRASATRGLDALGAASQ